MSRTRQSTNAPSFGVVQTTRRLRCRRLRLACLVILGLLAPGVGAGLASGQELRERLIAVRPVMTTGRAAALVWRSTDGPVGAGVYAAVPPEMPAQRLGPAASGDDGQPAGAARADGSTWVIASRSGPSRSRLWAQQFDGARWLATERGPSAGQYNRHPALASGGEAMWAVWIASEDVGSSGRAGLYASRRAGDGWTAPERLPQPSGNPWRRRLPSTMAGCQLSPGPPMTVDTPRSGSAGADQQGGVIRVR